MPGLFMENPAEVERIFVAHETTDLLNGIIGVFEEFFCLSDSDGGKVLHGGDTHIAFETADKPTYTHMLVFCIFFNTDVLGKGFVEKTDTLFHFLLIAESVCKRFKLASLYTLEKLLQKKTEKFFKAGAS